MLNPIASANWNYDAAAHLALRASLGEPPAELEKWVNQGLDSTLERLLRTPSPSVAPPAPLAEKIGRTGRRRNSVLSRTSLIFRTRFSRERPALGEATKLSILFSPNRNAQNSSPPNPPNVKGWDGGKSWINTATLAYRYELARELVSGILPEEVGLPKGPPKPSPSPTAKQLTVSGQTQAVANSPSPKPTVTLIPPPAPTPPSQLTGGLPVGRILTADDRRDSRRALQKLCQCIFQANPRPEFLEKFVQIANSKPHLDDRAIRDLAILMMSTPNYQLC